MRAAIDSYSRPIRDSLACVASNPMFTYQDAGVDLALALGLLGPPLELSRGSGLHDLPALFLSVQHRYIVLQSGPRSFEVATLAWTYQVLDEDGAEVLVFHWDPRGVRDFPHLHVGSVLLDPQRHHLGKAFSTLHIPTERISIEHVIRMLIEELDVRPVRSDWERVLMSGQRDFEERRSWPHNRYTPGRPPLPS